MAIVTQLILDVLKTHQPNALEFASQLADLGVDYQVNLTVQEVDDKTQSIVLTISGDNLDYAAISKCIESMGGSVHSIDEVNVRHSESRNYSQNKTQ